MTNVTKKFGEEFSDLKKSQRVSTNKGLTEGKNQEAD